jgi:hypothetical protein
MSNCLCNYQKMKEDEKWHLAALETVMSNAAAAKVAAASLTAKILIFVRAIVSAENLARV